jgi:ATP-binding cassette subfamily B multidrug efflux pump
VFVIGSMRRILGLLKPYKHMVFLGFLFQGIVIATRLIQPLATRAVVNDVIMASQHGRLIQLIAMLLGLSLVRAVTVFFRVILLEKASQSVAYDLRTRLFKHLQKMTFTFYDQNRVGEIMSRMTGDLEGVRDYLSSGLITAFEQTVTFTGAVIFMFVISWQSALTILLILPFIAVIAFRFHRKIRPVFRAVREQSAELNTRVQENIAGIHVVKAFVREKYEQQLLEKENRKLLDLNLEVTYTWSDYVPLIQFLSELCTPVVLASGAVLMGYGLMDVGTLVGVTGYIWMLTMPMRMLSQITNAATRAITSAEKIFYYLDLGPEIRDAETTLQAQSNRGGVQFDDVSFKYGDQSVLANVSFQVKPGQTIGIMGPTGAGKSTIIKLMGRFYDVSSGSVLVDGIDVRKQPLHCLRAKIGYVPQETFLFSESILENIRFGRPDAETDDVKNAADIAQALPFIMKMPHQFETVVGERGVGLSGGQKQRTAIARALLIDPVILVLDDATSAVDMQTEYQIQQKLEKAQNNRTTFIIAHRVSSVKNADLIIVLENGRIVEQGNHQELLTRKGAYWHMWQEQLTAITGEGGSTAYGTSHKTVG